MAPLIPSPRTRVRLSVRTQESVEGARAPDPGVMVNLQSLRYLTLTMTPGAARRRESCPAA